MNVYVGVLYSTDIFIKKYFIYHQISAVVDISKPNSNITTLIIKTLKPSVVHSLISFGKTKSL